MAMSIPREERDAGNIRKVEEVGLLNGGAIIHPSLKKIRRCGVQQKEKEVSRSLVQGVSILVFLKFSPNKKLYAF